MSDQCNRTRQFHLIGPLKVKRKTCQISDFINQTGMCVFVSHFSKNLMPTKTRKYREGTKQNRHNNMADKQLQIDESILCALTGQSIVVPAAPDLYTRFKACTELPIPQVLTDSPASLAMSIWCLVTFIAFG